MIVTRAVLATAAAESARTDGSTGELLLSAVACDFAPDCEGHAARLIAGRRVLVVDAQTERGKGGGYVRVSRADRLGSAGV